MELKIAETKQDLQQIESLAQEIWRECYAEILSAQQMEYMLDKFQSVNAMQVQIKNEAYEYFLVQDKEQSVGYCALQIKDKKLFISKVYLLKSSRGTGLAAEIFTFIENTAVKQKCKALWLTVNIENARAIAAYEKRGFAKLRTQVADIGEGYVMDDYIMEKKI